MYNIYKYIIKKTTIQKKKIKPQNCWKLSYFNLINLIYKINFYFSYVILLFFINKYVQK